MKFGWIEILLILVLVIILFGHNKIPSLMKNLANGINIFKKEMNDKKSNDAPKKSNSKPVKKVSKKPANTPVKKATKKVVKK